MTKFSSKYNNLENIRNIVRIAIIPSSYYLEKDRWLKNKKAELESIVSLFSKSRKVIIRSNSSSEDTVQSSNAGKYKTVVVDLIKSNISAGISEVFSSYHYDNELLPSVFIQEYVEVDISGVAFNRDPKSNLPYTLVDFTHNSDTSLVTSGRVNSQTTVSVSDFRNNDTNFIKEIKELFQQLYIFFNDIPLDIEFGFNSLTKQMYLFQVRPLVIKVQTKVDKSLFLHNLEQLFLALGKRMSKHPYLLGNTTFLDVMSDWNPVEMIGYQPRPLALSLYKDLITDSTWAYQRDNYGYRNLRGFPLLTDLFGQPYIDIRLSFNSFVPKNLDVIIGEKLVNYYLEIFREKPHLHDKVEFEILFSCFTFDLQDKFKERKLTEILDQESLKSLTDELRALTSRILFDKNSLFLRDKNKITSLAFRRNEILESNLDNLTKVFWLLEDARRYGTLPFAGLARAGFIGMEMLKSLVNLGIFTQTDFQSILHSVNSISKHMAKDFETLTLPNFLKIYGHLRPGTYDISSPRYDQNPEIYFRNFNGFKFHTNQVLDFTLSSSQEKAINNLLLENGLECSVLELLDFIRESIRLRELAKFEFTKNISEILELLKIEGEKLNLSDNDMSFLTIGSIRKFQNHIGFNDRLIKEEILINQNLHKNNTGFNFPETILKPSDIYNYTKFESQPNFITNKSFKGEPVLATPELDLDGKVVFIEYADPGYDWIFLHRIAGFITKFGGQNSHMAIRSYELGIPAVIGVGEILFDRWKNKNYLLIDCNNKKVDF